MAGVDSYEPVCYTGAQRVNVDYTDGRLKPALGVWSVQAVCCDPTAEGLCQWTYNHAPMLANFRGTLLLSYLSNPHSEHVAPGRTLLCWAREGLSFSRPVVLFPEYAIPNGVFAWEGAPLPDGSWAVMHQRMGFYEAVDGRMLALGNYGISPDGNVVPFGPLSIGRVVREVLPDLSLGPIFFIRYTVGTVWNEKNTHYPPYTRSPDAGFVRACDALLADPLVTQQWAEEQGDEDPLITLKARDCGTLNNKAFCHYRLPDGSVMGLWKWMRCARSTDGGHSWLPQRDTEGIWHAGGKIWGQRTSDGRYALLYNPHTANSRRWPLAIVTGGDGVHFDNMRLVAGDLSPLRHGGAHKGRGFHYVRGIENCGGESPDGALYVAYSVNKEDIWVSRIPVPVRDADEAEVCEDFGTGEDKAFLSRWNLHLPAGDCCRVERGRDGQRQLVLRGQASHDALRATRLFRAGSQVTVSIALALEGAGALDVELVSDEGDAPLRLTLDAGEGMLWIAHGRKEREAVAPIRPGYTHRLTLHADAKAQRFSVSLDGKPLGREQTYQGQRAELGGWYFRAPVTSLSCLVLRTGEARRHFSDHIGVKPTGQGRDAQAVCAAISTVIIASR